MLFDVVSELLTMHVEYPELLGTQDSVVLSNGHRHDRVFGGSQPVEEVLFKSVAVKIDAAVEGNIAHGERVCLGRDESKPVQIPVRNHTIGETDINQTS